MIRIGDVALGSLPTAQVGSLRGRGKMIRDMVKDSRNFRLVTHLRVNTVKVKFTVKADIIGYQVNIMMDSG